MLQMAFGVIALGAAVLVVGLVRHAAGGRRALQVAAGIAAWMLITLLLAAGGVLNDFSLPPRLLLVFVPALLAVGVVIFSSAGGVMSSSVSQVWLIGAQVFRLPVELAIHQAVVEGVAPPQLSWDGYNLDIVTALTAPVAAAIAWRLPQSRYLLILWNLVGLGLVLTVVGTAIVSMPTPFQQLKPDNTWIAFPPYVWLPTVLVMVALCLHGWSLRKLLKR
jgi:hypothetical protein